MLQMWFGSADDGILWNPDTWFEDEGYTFLNTDFSKRVIKDIDDCTYIADRVVDSSVLGVIPAVWLSSGSKTAIMLMYSSNPVDANYVGDNVVKYIREIGLEKDIVIVSGFILGIYFKELGGYDGYPMKVLNTNHVIHSGEEFFYEFEKAVPERGNYKKYPIYRG